MAGVRMAEGAGFGEADSGECADAGDEGGAALPWASGLSVDVVVAWVACGASEAVSVLQGGVASP